MPLFSNRLNVICTNSELTAKALQMAWELRGHPKQVMFHSDQGSH
ncbi:hypothetical protein [Candidatus Arsenophonus triatominarum]|nr:hypothetical protein [Candidatus Arsenophonus triatominarum]